MRFRDVFQTSLVTNPNLPRLEIFARWTGDDFQDFRLYLHSEHD